MHVDIETLNIESLSILIKNSIDNKLPGQKAQQAMSPSLRNTNNTKHKIHNAREASVLILLYSKNNTIHIPLILRTLGGNNHAGQISLPGGKVEKTDSSLCHTAIRETNEEIGILENSVNIIGELTSIYIQNSNFIVYPFIGYINHKAIFKINPFEVEDLLEIPLVDVFDNKNINEFSFIVNDTKVKAPYYAYKKHKIWGATAMILAELRQILILENLINH